MVGGMEPKTTRCTICSAEFTDAEIEEATCCPTCGTTGIPCAIEDDVTLKINWHELRILTIWADNYAREHTLPSSRATLTGILQRLQAQYPDKPPLTLMGEIEQLVAEGYNVEVVDNLGNSIPLGPPRGKA